ncbi:MAG: hypothetical protein GTO05_15495 [Gemmatimonadales bacterium]|nr:hypothetical protein [Gemmatimonadales bacterium]NIS66530.1 hypothetical protein [Gemmatimonadales bacterium]
MHQRNTNQVVELAGQPAAASYFFLRRRPLRRLRRMRRRLLPIFLLPRCFFG